MLWIKRRHFTHCGTSRNKVDDHSMTRLIDSCLLAISGTTSQRELTGRLCWDCPCFIWKIFFFSWTKFIWWVCKTKISVVKIYFSIPLHTSSSDKFMKNYRCISKKFAVLQIFSNNPLFRPTNMISLNQYQLLNQDPTHHNVNICLQYAAAEKSLLPHQSLDLINASDRRLRRGHPAVVTTSAQYIF